jgi:hypothetical protein
MAKEICYEYVVGRCTKELFRVDGLTRRCHLKHEERKRQEYELNKRTRTFDFERGVCQSYLRIVKECDRRTKNNKGMLASLKYNTEEYSKRIAAIKHIATLLDSKREQINRREYLTALEMHGKLVAELQAEESGGTSYGVCDNCSAFLTNKKCTHRFCEAYRYLRAKGSELCKRLYGPR